MALRVLQYLDQPSTSPDAEFPQPDQSVQGGGSRLRVLQDLGPAQEAIAPDQGQAFLAPTLPVDKNAVALEVIEHELSSPAMEAHRQQAIAQNWTRLGAEFLASPQGQRLHSERLMAISQLQESPHLIDSVRPDLPDTGNPAAVGQWLRAQSPQNAAAKDQEVIERVNQQLRGQMALALSGQKGSGTPNVPYIQGLATSPGRGAMGLFGGGLQAAGDVTGKALEAVGAEDYGRRVKYLGREWNQGAQEVSQFTIPQSTLSQNAEWYHPLRILEQAGESTPSLAIGMLSGGGGTGAQLATMFMMEAGGAYSDAYGRAKASGLSDAAAEEAAGNVALQTGAINALLEKAGLDEIMAAGGKRLLVRMAKAAAAEGTTEGAQEANQILAEWGNGMPSSWRQALERIASSVATGGVMGGGARGVVEMGRRPAPAPAQAPAQPTVQPQPMTPPPTMAEAEALTAQVLGEEAGQRRNEADQAFQTIKRNARQAEAPEGTAPVDLVGRIRGFEADQALAEQQARQQPQPQAVAVPEASTGIETPPVQTAPESQPRPEAPADPFAAERQQQGEDLALRQAAGEITGGQARQLANRRGFGEEYRQAWKIIRENPAEITPKSRNQAEIKDTPDIQVQGQDVQVAPTTPPVETTTEPVATKSPQEAPVVPAPQAPPVQPAPKVEVKPAKPPREFSVSDLRKKVSDWYSTSGMSDAEGQQFDRWYSQHGEAGFRYRDKLPESVAAEIGPDEKHLHRFFRKAQPGQAAEMEDAISTAGGFAEYVDMARRASKSGTKQARQAALKSDDPQVRFSAELLDQVEAIRREKAKESPKRMIDTKKIPAWHEFTINGEKFRVIEDEDGNRVAEDGGDFTPIPLDAMKRLPIDRGSLKEAAEPEVPDFDADITAELAPEPKVMADAPSAMKKDLFGKSFIDSSGVGEQGALFTETAKAEGPKDDAEMAKIRRLNKASEKATAEMFQSPATATEAPPRPSPTTPVVESTTPVVDAKAKARAAALRKMADNLESKIEDMRRPMTQNPTPKRNREYNSRRHDANNAERAQKAMRAMADAVEAGTLPKVLEGVKTKDQIATLVRKGLLGGGYYDVIPDPSYADKSPAGKALQGMIERAEMTPQQRAAAEERAKADRIRELEDKVRFSPIPGFFPTPKPLISKMLGVAEIRPGMKVLEPSAGKGDIADAIREQGVKPDVVEISGALRPILEAKGHNLVGDNFLAHTGEYDRIVMNPPFEKGQEIDHVRLAYELLKPGGRIVSIMSEGPFSRSDSKATGFRDWLEEVGGTSEKNEQGAFTGAESFRQTGTSTRMVVIDKPDAQPLRVEPKPEQPTESRARLSLRKSPAPTHGMSVAGVKASIKRITDRFPGWDVEVYPSERFAPEDAREAIHRENASGQVEAMVMPDGRVMIFADKVQSAAHARQLVFHEGVGHSIISVLPEHEVRRLARYVEANDPDLLAAIREAYPEAQVLDESLARLSERYADTPPAQKPAWWKQILHRLRVAFSRILGTMPSEAEVEELIQKAAGRVQEAGGGDAKFSRTLNPEPSEYNPEAEEAFRQGEESGVDAAAERIREMTDKRTFGREDIRNLRRVVMEVRRNRKATVEEVRALQKSLVQTISNNLPESADRAKMLAAITNTTDPREYSKALNRLVDVAATANVRQSLQGLKSVAGDLEPRKGVLEVRAASPAKRTDPPARPFQYPHESAEQYAGRIQEWEDGLRAWQAERLEKAKAAQPRVYKLELNRLEVEAGVGETPLRQQAKQVLAEGRKWRKLAETAQTTDEKFEAAEKLREIANQLKSIAVADAASKEVRIAGKLEKLHDVIEDGVQHLGAGVVSGREASPETPDKGWSLRTMSRDYFRAQLNPRTRMGIMFGRASKMYKALIGEVEQGERAKAGFVKGAIEHLEQALTEAGYDPHTRKLDDFFSKEIEVDFPEAGKVKLTRGKATDLVAALNDPETRAEFDRGVSMVHKENEFGEPFKINSRDVMYLQDSGIVRPEDVKFYKKIQSLIYNAAPDVMGAAMRIKGYAPDWHKGYWPRSRRMDKGAELPNSWAGMQKRLENQGILEARTPNADAPYVLRDVVQTYLDYVDSAGDLMHMAEPIRQANAIIENKRLQQAIVAGYGRNPINGMRQYVKDLVAAHLPHNSTGDRLMRFLMRNTSRAWIPLNKAVLATNIVTGPLKLALKFEGQDLAHGMKYAFSSEARQEMMQDPALWSRYNNGLYGQYSPITGERTNPTATLKVGEALNVGRTLKALKARDVIEAGKALKAVRPGQAIDGMPLMPWADQTAFAVAYKAAQHYVERTMTSRPQGIAEADWTEAKQQAIYAMVEDATRDTQNGTSPTEVSQLHSILRQNPWSAWAAMFQSDASKAFNLMAEALASKKNRTKTAGILLASAALYGVIPPAFQKLYNEIARALFGGEEPEKENEDLWKRAGMRTLRGMSGMAWMLDKATDVVGQVFAGKSPAMSGIPSDTIVEMGADAGGVLKQAWNASGEIDPDEQEAAWARVEKEFARLVNSGSTIAGNPFAPEMGTWMRAMRQRNSRLDTIREQMKPLDDRFKGINDAMDMEARSEIETDKGVADSFRDESERLKQENPELSDREFEDLATYREYKEAMSEVRQGIREGALTREEGQEWLKELREELEKEFAKLKAK
jgi:hypothetical protein